MPKDVSAWSKNVRITAHVLREAHVVDHFDDGDHIEADAIAHALWDMDESFRKLTNEVFPKILDENLTAEQVREILFEVREDLRHAVYHIADCKFLKDILD